MSRYYLILCLGMALQGDTAEARLIDSSVKCIVSDEQGRPVPGAVVRLTFSEDLPRGKGWGTKVRGDIRLPVDSKGQVETVRKSNGMLTVSASHPDYYKSSKHLSVMKEDDIRYGVWRSEVILTLKRKINPLPMGVKSGPNISAETTIPSIGKPVGYDLVVSDWVKPHGKGVTADMVFLLKTRYVNNADCEVSLTVSCPNDGDGLQSVFAPRSYESESELRFPYEAPEDKYEPSVTRFMRNSPEKPFATDMRDDQSYFFRIRTRKEEGKIVSAQYGIVDGNIEFSIQGTLRFRYLLNLTPNSRNVEWDGKHNLFDPETLEDLKSPGETGSVTNAPTKPRKPILEPPPPPTKPK